jgi:hypothetical protein
LQFGLKYNVSPYLNPRTTYEGSNGASKPTLVPRSGPIHNPIAVTST